MNRNIKKGKIILKKLSKRLKKTDAITTMTLQKYKIYIDDNTKTSKYLNIS